MLRKACQAGGCTPRAMDDNPGPALRRPHKRLILQKYYFGAIEGCGL